MVNKLYIFKNKNIVVKRIKIGDKKMKKIVKTTLIMMMLIISTNIYIVNANVATNNDEDFKIEIIGPTDDFLLESKTFYVDDDGIADFTSIQSAINAAEEYDTVFVYAGIYNEDIYIERPVYLRGEEKETTIINGTGEDNVVTIVGNYIEISNFTIQNSNKSGYNPHYYWSGIEISFDEGKGNYNKIESCIVKDNNNGICLKGNMKENEFIDNIVKNNSYYGIFFQGNAYGVDDILFSGNTVMDNGYIGIELGVGKNNTLENNDIKNSGYAGIRLSKQKNLIIISNTIQNNDRYGICVDNADNITINKNSIISNDVGMEIRGHIKDIKISDNHLLDNPNFGIYIVEESGDILITKNTIEYLLSSFNGNNYGVYIRDSSHITLTNNEINHYRWGLYISNSSYVKVYKNTISNSNLGVYLYYCTLVNITCNNFVYNEKHAQFYIKDLSHRINVWDSNYWNRPRILPMFIFGKKRHESYVRARFAIEIDWNPALRPYLI